ncbi:glucose-6-phosphate exchanger SLC37A2 isoform X1 [Anopheles arabiensis]|uniref:Major facilitator superfamily (MFS) profile domain-containing protein n=1 Tax=Anopheles arabiensis TaxID=7173 RepID=A0A182I3Z8_ANOAR|nr:glucose-6-phosphate exchanger SLC37A2 isoform X1 [Anopheles arabiensis]XP_040163182.1 glucose-6-phosphate exchanger SLC37A2 isoform X1 [Anopheles arabiensis]
MQRARVPSTGRQQRMSSTYPSAPIGVRLISYLSAKLCPRLQVNRVLWFKCSVLGLTYLAYTCYHMTRKPISVVKSVLHRNCSTVTLPPEFVTPGGGGGGDPTVPPPLPTDGTWCDYAPFDQPDFNSLFGALDSAFLFSYAIAMFFAGFIAERVSLRYFLALGMAFSGLFCYLFGMAKVYDIHALWYFVAVQALAGMFQTTGWPGVVTIVGRWFGKSKRGLIFGIWNSHTSIGNVLGTLIAAHYVERDWSMSFVVPGFVMGLCGFLMFLFVVERPEIVDCQEKVADYAQQQRGSSAGSSVRRMDDSVSDVEDSGVSAEQDNVSTRTLRGSYYSEINERTPILGSINRAPPQHDAIGFFGALRIPGVIEFSLSLFFSKLVSYTFLFWLPFYIQHSTSMGAKLSADVSTVFDIGGIIGAIAAGMMSDASAMPATTCTGMLAIAAPLLLIYRCWGSVSLSVNILLLFVVGLMVNGPYALITTSVSAELGQHSSLNGNSKALATVTAIIDGTGSIGAAIGPLLAGMVSGWNNVFYMLVISDVLALAMLLRISSKECSRRNINRRYNVRIE